MKFSLDWLCDYADFRGIGDEQLAATANEIGLEIGQVEKDGSDTILETDVTPNRPDAMNHRGFARDLAAAFGRPFDNARFRPALAEGRTSVSSLARVTIEVPDRCHRFGLRAIRNVVSRPSSETWTRRMGALGLKSIDAIVDATNISLWGLGQPLHAFDADKVAGGRLVVRLAKKGEKLRCLDGVERTLDPEDVVVADERRALSLGGVIGGIESAIVPGVTRNVLLEAAWWDPLSIRRTARRHGLHTDASHRYERGADPEAIPEGLSLAASLILERGGGELAAGMIDEHPRPWTGRRVGLRHSRLLLLSGLRELSIERASEILERLGFEARISGGSIECEVPSWRPDVAIEEDLLEEVVRIHGYSKIPSDLPPAERLAPLYLSGDSAEGRAPREIEDVVADAAREAGLFESMSFPFVARETTPDGNLLEKAAFRKEALLVANPLDATRPALRRLILPGLLESAELNRRNGRTTIPLFEIGRVWDRPSPEGSDPAEAESRHIALVLGGAAPGELPVREATILDAKGMLGRILEAVAGEPAAFSAAARPPLPEGQALEVRIGGRKVGILGKTSAFLVAEIDLGGIPRSRPEAAFREYSRYPAADVDVTVACRPGIAWGEIEQAVRGARPAELEEAILLRLFEDPARPGTRNVTLRLTFRASDRTLSQEEVNRERDRLLDILNERFGVRT